MTTPVVSQRPVLLVDDEPALLRSASLLLRAAGITPILTLDDSRLVLSRVADDTIGAVVLDLTMPYLSGQALLEQITAHDPDLPTIVMTATHDLETAVQCMQAGAIDYLVKPVDKHRLVSSVRRALERRTLQEEVGSLTERPRSDTPHQRQAFAEIVTQNTTMQALFRYVEAIAQSPQPVLITGETGTGKELLARAVHRLAAPRGDFVAVNVAGLDDQVFSDTLFGHTRGAFTGADRPREGLITRAEEGTLFLDEIGDLAAVSQVKLLRLLQDGTYYPLGADRPRQSRARVVVATNRDVVQDVQAGTFRKDLYYRLRAHHIQLPPLRTRRDDLVLLVNYSLAKAAAALHKPVPTPPLALYQLLNTYAFPGNVRELEAMVFDAVARHQGGSLSLQAFKDAMGTGRPLLAGEPLSNSTLASQSSWDVEPLPTLKEAEDALIAAALRHADGNQGVAAGLLGVSRQALNKRLRRRQPLAGLPPA
jgi:two-component system, NtrC family, nitrogen regulation response regulator GlnG